jgi:uncharacterized lipoprotein YmbA
MRAPWLVVLAAGCALSTKSAPLELRYFSPEAPEAAAPAVRAEAVAPRGRLRLGRVTPSAHLRYRIVHRTSDVERQLSETLRWTDAPDAYVRRALSRALFEGRALEQVVGGAAPTLDVEVIAFEAVHRHPDRHAGRVELRYQLHDERAVLESGGIAVERPARGPEIEVIVAAIGDAMSAATAEVAARIARRLGAQEAPGQPLHQAQ